MRGTCCGVFDFGGSLPLWIASLTSMTKRSINGFMQKLKCIFVKSEFSVLFNAVYYLEKFIDNFGGKVVCGSFHFRQCWSEG